MKKITFAVTMSLLGILALSYDNIKDFFKPDEEAYASIESVLNKDLNYNKIKQSENSVYVPFLAENLTSPVKAEKSSVLSNNQYFFKQKNDVLTDINLTADAYYAMDIKTNQPLLEKNIIESRQLASITKIMTAIVVLDEYKMGKGDYLEMTDSAYATYGGNTINVGEKFRIEDLLKATLMISNNDTAALLGEKFGPGIDNFSIKMNQKAKQIGMSKSKFVNPHGLDSGEDHYSTAEDVMKMMVYSFEKYPDIWDILRIKEEYIISATGNTLRVGNTNAFIDMEWSYGGKTGLTYKAKETFATIIDIQGRKVGVVVMGSRIGGYRFTDTRKIKEWIEINFEQRL